MSFKLVTKVLVNRLKTIIEEIVSPNQSSFIPRRQLTDNIIICQEMIHTLKHKIGRSRDVIIKINLEKAYNRLEWHFIKQTLVDVGLPQLMVNVIMECRMLPFA